jgi:hypothetical protein
MWTVFVWLRIGTGGSSCEFGIEASGSIHAGKLSSVLTTRDLSSSAQLHEVVS